MLCIANVIAVHIFVLSYIRTSSRTSRTRTSSTITFSLSTPIFSVITPVHHIFVPLRTLPFSLCIWYCPFIFHYPFRPRCSLCYIPFSHYHLLLTYISSSVLSFHFHFHSGPFLCVSDTVLVFSVLHVFTALQHLCLISFYLSTFCHTVASIHQFHFYLFATISLCGSSVHVQCFVPVALLSSPPSTLTYS